MNVGPIKIRDNSSSERRKEFNISIGSIEPVNYNILGIRTAVQGDPVKIIAYDNDCKLHSHICSHRYKTYIIPITY